MLKLRLTKKVLKLLQNWHHTALIRLFKKRNKFNPVYKIPDFDFKGTTSNRSDNEVPFSEYGFYPDYLFQYIYMEFIIIMYLQNIKYDIFFSNVLINIILLILVSIEMLNFYNLRNKFSNNLIQSSFNVKSLVWMYLNYFESCIYHQWLGNWYYFFKF